MNAVLHFPAALQYASSTATVSALASKRTSGMSGGRLLSSVDRCQSLRCNPCDRLTHVSADSEMLADKICSIDGNAACLIAGPANRFNFERSRVPAVLVCVRRGAAIHASAERCLLEPPRGDLRADSSERGNSRLRERGRAITAACIADERSISRHGTTANRAHENRSALLALAPQPTVINGSRTHAAILARDRSRKYSARRCTLEYPGSPSPFLIRWQVSYAIPDSSATRRRSPLWAMSCSRT